MHATSPPAKRSGVALWTPTVGFRKWTQDRVLTANAFWMHYKSRKWLCLLCCKCCLWEKPGYSFCICARCSPCIWCWILTGWDTPKTRFFNAGIMT